MIQYIRSYTAIGLTTNLTTPSYVHPFSCGSWAFNSYVDGSAPWAVAGNFTKLTVKVTTALSGSNTATFTLYKNGSSTGLTVTLTSASQTGTVSSTVAVAAGDTISLHALGGTGTQSVGRVHSDLTFESTASSEHCYAGRLNSNDSGGGMDTLTRRTNPLFHVGGWSSVNVGVFAADCTISALYVVLTNTIAAGTTRTLVLRKNGTVQDGTGGTPDTRVTISAGSSTGSATFSLSYSAGDTIEIQNSSTGSVSTNYAGWGLAATASVDGRSTVNVRQGTFGNNTRYSSIYGWIDSVLSSEATHQRAEFASWTLRGLYTLPDGSIGGSGFTQTIRIGGVATSVTGTTGTGSGVQALSTSTVAIAADDLLSFQSVGTSGVSSRNFTIAYAMEVIQATPPSGPHIEALTVADAVSLRANPGLISISDAVTVSESVETGLYLIVDAVTVGESVKAVMPIYLRVSDTLGLVDRTTLKTTALYIRAADTVTAVEGPLNHNAFGIGPDATPLPAILQDYWTVGIV